MKMTDEFPQISKALMEHLEKQLPPKDFEPTANMNDVMYYSGQRKVIGMLRHQYNLQNETILTPNVK